MLSPTSKIPVPHQTASAGSYKAIVLLEYTEERPGGLIPGYSEVCSHQVWRRSDPSAAWQTQRSPAVRRVALVSAPTLQCRGVGSPDAQPAPHLRCCWTLSQAPRPPTELTVTPLPLFSAHRSLNKTASGPLGWEQRLCYI